MLKLASIVLGAALVAAPVAAHPKLIRTIPVANTTVAAPASIMLSFNERIVPHFTGANVTMRRNSGAARQVGGFTLRFAEHGKSFTLASAKPLAQGSYAVAWHAVAADTHRVTGSFAFQVR